MITPTWSSYKLMTDLLAVHGIDMPFVYDRSTLHRWRASGLVPDLSFRLMFYYSSFQLLAFDIDVRQCLDVFNEGFSDAKF